MANGERGIIRIIRLLLDRDSARRTEREAQEALKRGTDPREPRRNLSRIEEGLGTLKRAAAAVGAAFVAAFALNRLRQFGTDAIRMAGEVRKENARLAGTVRGVGVAYEQVSGEIQQHLRGLWDSHRLTVSGATPLLQRLIARTGDYAASLRNVGLAADVAAGLQMDQASAADLVAKVMGGNVAILRRHGIEANNSAEALELLRTRFSGMARQTTTFGEQWAAVWGDFKEAVGEAMLQAGGGTSVIDTLTGAVRGLTRWVEDNNESIQFWAGTLVSATEWTTRQAGRFLEGLQRRLEGLQRTWNWLRGRQDFSGVQSGGSSSAPAGGLVIPVRPTASPEQLANARRQAEQIAAEVQRTLERLSRPDWLGMAAPAHLTSGLLHTGPRDRAALPFGQVQAAGGMGALIAAADQHIYQLTTMEQLSLQVWSNVGDVAASAAHRMMYAWQDAFALMITEGANLGNFIESMARGMAGAFLSSIRDLAAGKVAQNIAWGLEAMGITFGSAAIGNAPSAGSAGASASYHFASAAQWALLGAGAGALATAAVGGRGGRGAPALHGARDVGLGIAQNMARPPAQIYITVDGMDPDNPRHHDLFYQTMRGATERHGGAEVYLNGRRVR